MKGRIFTCAAVVAAFAILTAVRLFTGGELKKISSTAQAAVQVDNFDTLKSVLESDGRKTISLSKNITITKKIIVQGDKTIYGNGHTLRRSYKDGKVYKGTLFYLGNGKGGAVLLTLNDTVVSGSGDQSNTANAVEGRLFELMNEGSHLYLRGKTRLIHNVNTTLRRDGGGAVTVYNACHLVMLDSSEIVGNKSTTGGAGVRVLKGGGLQMKGGQIRGNSVQALSATGDYRGLGGGVHSEGNVSLEGGRIHSNAASGLGTGSQSGGLGGGVYSNGDLRIKGGWIYDNIAAEGGGGVYATNSSTVQMRDGKVFRNRTSGGLGGGFYVNQNSSMELYGGSIYSNEAWSGGGLYVSKKGSSLQMTGGYIYSNSAVGRQNATGGGIRNNQGLIQLMGGKIGLNENGAKAGNRAPNSPTSQYGCCIYNQGILKADNVMISNDGNNSYPIVNEDRMEYDYEKANGFQGTGNVAIRNTGCLEIGKRKKTLFDTDYLTAVENRGILAITKDSLVRGKDYGVLSEERLEMSGAVVEGGKNAVYAKAGIVRMGEKIKCKSIYLAQGVYIQALKEIENVADVIEVEPQDYTEGRLLVKDARVNPDVETLKTKFSLKKKKGYFMYAKNPGLYIGEEKYTISFDGNGGDGKMEDLVFPLEGERKLPHCKFIRQGYAFLGWSFKRIEKGAREDVKIKDEEKVNGLGKNGERIVLYAVWSAYPKMIDSSKNLAFYEGEQVKAALLRKYVTATDESDGDITSHIILKSIQYADGAEVFAPYQIQTEARRLGRATANFSVANKNGLESHLEMKFDIVENRAPSLAGEDRYFFLSEVEGKSQSQLEAMIWDNLVWSDDIENKEELFTNHSIVLDMPMNKAGSYVAELSIRDQYGHRFYMNENEKKQYGTGKTAKRKIQIIIVENRKEEIKRAGYVRFVSGNYLDTLFPNSKWKSGILKEELNVSFGSEPKEIKSMWHFTKEDVKASKVWLKEFDNPFSQIANQRFLSLLNERKGFVRKGVTK